MADPKNNTGSMIIGLIVVVALIALGYYAVQAYGSNDAGNGNTVNVEGGTTGGLTGGTTGSGY